MFPNHIASADAVPSNTAAAVATGSVVTDLTSTTEVGGGDNHNNSSTGFDLINHAIRMGGGGGGGVSSSALDEMANVARRSNELLSMKTRLLQRQGSNNLNLNHNDRFSSAVAAAAANRVKHHQQLQAQQQQKLQAQLRHHQQQLQASVTVTGGGGNSGVGGIGGIGGGIDDGGIVAALRNQHNLPLHPTPQQRHNNEQHEQGQHGQHEQNARQLNPNAFQFPWKLHDMLDRSFSEGYDDVVSWIDDGQAFRVHKAEVFVDHIMSRFFKQTKYKSFQRQLNLYGFTRIQNGNCKGGYKHKFFRRGQRTMCQLITRCAVRDKDEEDSNDDIEQLARSHSMSNNESGNNNKSIVDNDGNIANNSMNNINSDNTSYNTLNVPSNVSISSKELSNVVLPMVPTSASASSMLLAGHTQRHHQATAAMIAERQHNIDAAITNISNFQLMADTTSQRLQIEKYRQEHQQLQQLRAQHFSLQQLRNHQQREAAFATISAETGHQLGMMAPVAGMNHSSSVGGGGGGGSAASISSSIARQVTINTGDNIKNPSTTGGSSSNMSGASHVTPNYTPRTPDQDTDNVILHKEFQFPWKLFEMLERCEVDGFSNMVSWMPGDTCFRVHDTDNFVKEVMSMFFKQTKYKSFQRQLNLYGFIRVDTGPNRGAYRHPYFVKGRKDMLALITRIKIKGTGTPRRAKVFTNNGGDYNVKAANEPKGNDQDTADTTSWSGVASSHHAGVSDPVPADQRKESGIDVILEAIMARERTDSNMTGAPTSTASNGHVITVDAGGSSNSNSSNSTIPSTIDVTMKDADAQNNSGLSWRQHPSESFSDWTIEAICDDSTESAVYHVHRRVLAVGPKKSNYFANIFKYNSSANRNQLSLNKRQAAVFPMVLDFIYADVEFDLDTEKAYTLHSLAEKLEIAAIVQKVTEFYCKWVMNKENIYEFIKLGKSFRDRTLLDAAIQKFAEDIWSIDVKMGAKIDPVSLSQALAFLQLGPRSSVYDSNRLSQVVAMCVSNATRSTLGGGIFQLLTDKSILPSIEPIAAITLLATENTLLSGQNQGSIPTGDPSLHERCSCSIHENWEIVSKLLEESIELANTMRSISSLVLFDLLMKTNRTSKACEKTSGNSEACDVKECDSDSITF